MGFTEEIDKRDRKIADLQEELKAAYHSQRMARLKEAYEKIADFEQQLAEMAKTIATQNEMLLDCNASSSALKAQGEEVKDGKGRTNARPPIPNEPAKPAAAEKKED